MPLGQPLGPDVFDHWFPSYRILVDRLAQAMDDLLGDEVDVDTPALAIELADVAYRWAVQMGEDTWNEGYATAAGHSAAGTLGKKHPGNPYAAQPVDGGSPTGRPLCVREPFEHRCHGGICPRGECAEFEESWTDAADDGGDS